MGFVSDVFAGLTGSGVDAAEDAAAAQVKSTQQAIDFQKESLQEARSDLDPFSQEGVSAATGLSDLITDPNQQLDYIQNNPFFEALAKKSTDTLLTNQAAKGKAGSGGTAEALQNSLLLLGTDLVNQNINQRSNLSALGANTAAQQGAFSVQTGANVGSTFVEQGNAEASGIMGAHNAGQQALGTAVQVGGMIAACDERVKDNALLIGYSHNGIPVHAFKYKGCDKWNINMMAQDVELVRPDAVLEVGGMKLIKQDVAWH